MSNFQLGIIDTSLDSHNIGDKIIMESVDRFVDEILGLEVSMRLPSHRIWTSEEIERARRIDYWLVGGTNLLDSYFPLRRQWEINPAQFYALKGKVLLLGVGWRNYQNNFNAFSRFAYEQLLSKEVPHSVRDTYTLKKLSKLKLDIVNTSCPTMWNANLDKQTHRESGVVSTLTNYNQDSSRDRKMLEHVKSNYGEVLFWAQNSDDWNYAKSLGIELTYIGSQLNELDAALKDGYGHIGTRLHAGIRALQHSRSTLIIGIDNRSIEISKDTGLPILSTTEISKGKTLLRSVEIKLNVSNIEMYTNKLKKAL